MNNIKNIISQAVVQIIQQVAGQQNPQEEEMEGQYSNKQEEGMEMAQQGGEKDDINKYILSPEFNKEELFINQPYTRELGDKGWLSGNVSDENVSERIRLQRQRLPYLTDSYFSSDDVAQADIEKYQKSYNEYIDSAEKAIDRNKNLTNKQKDKLKERLKTERFDPNQVAKGFDKKYGNFTSSRVGVALPLITNKDREKYPNLKFINDVVDKDGNIKEEYKDLSSEAKENIKATQEDGVMNRNIGILDYGDTPQKAIETPTDKSQNISTDKQTQTEYKDRVKNIMPNFAPYMPYLSPLQPVAKQQVDFTRIAPIKLTPEPMLAEQERQRLTDTERVTQLGLSPQQQEAILAQGLASSQLASNDAIAKTETWNAQNQFQTDSYNAGMSDKEKLMNIQLVTDYEGKTMQSLSNQEASLNNIYREQFLQNQSDNNYVTGLNKFNTLSDQFSVTPYGVEYLNNNRPSEEMDWKFLEGMTPEQRLEWKKLEIEKAKLKNFAQQGKRYSK